MTKKLSEYEKMARRHAKASANIVAYLRKIVMKTLPYHTAKIPIEDIIRVCDKADRLETKIDKANEKIEKLENHSRKCLIWRYSALGCLCGLYKKAEVKP